MFKTILIAIVILLAIFNAIAFWCACIVAGKTDREMNLK